jgi:steroid delta-isomerase-like uncharacterized protein
MFVSPEQIAHKYYDLFNARRFDEAERLIAPETLFQHPGFAHHLVGPAAHRALSQLWLGAFPDLQLLILRIRSDGDHVVSAQAVASGTHKGVLKLGTVIVPPTGRRMRVEYQHVLQIQDGRIVRLALDLDVQGLVRQLTTA